MAGKFAKISWLEGAVLLLTACFAAGTLLWFHTVQPEEVQVTKNPTAQTSQPAEEPEAPGMLEGEVLDLNTATLSDLMRLPGIGEKKGSAILAWRQEKGGFSAVEEAAGGQGHWGGHPGAAAPYVTVGVPAVEKGGDHGTDSGG
ncbi:MAG: ComEA family DNA-binding protein [Evtepia gabavorous]